MNRKIAIVMGSDSDFEKMKAIIPVLEERGIDYEFRVISAHRTPWIAAEFAKNAKEDGYDLIIAGAGMSAHLPGVLAAFTAVPVIGVPIKSQSSGMDGMDALHSIIQMPPGIPVASVGIDNARGAALLAAKMIECHKGGKAKVKIVHNSDKVKSDDLEKITKALDGYAIHWEVENSADFKAGDSFAIINLTDENIEKSLETQEETKNLPIIEVPQKALTNNFGDTSAKIYKQTGDADAVAFVGVNSFQNAGLMAGRILGIHDEKVHEKVIEDHGKLGEAVIEKDAKLRQEVNANKRK